MESKEKELPLKDIIEKQASKGENDTIILAFALKMRPLLQLVNLYDNEIHENL